MAVEQADEEIGDIVPPWFRREPVPPGLGWAGSGRMRFSGVFDADSFVRKWCARKDGCC